MAVVTDGISALNGGTELSASEAIRVMRPGGKVLFSSYAEKFWPDRLNWFRIQADCGLLGEIDEAATGHGVIVCKDGFSATTISPDARTIAQNCGIRPILTEVDESSLFCEIKIP